MDPKVTDELFDMYFRAVEQNVGNDRLTPLGWQVHVQVMPDAHNYGGIILANKPKDLGGLRIWCRYGTVLRVGSKVHGLSPGDVVVFSNMVGVKYVGQSNPLSLKGKIHSQDEIRIFWCRPSYCEVWGVWHETYAAGTKVRYQKPGDATVFNATVIREFPGYGGRLKVATMETSPTGESWLPYSWIIKEEHAEERGQG